MNFDYLNPYHRLFWEESLEQIKELEADLMQLEANPHETEIIQRLFRNAHSLKGSSATMEIVDITEITHRMETLFDNARKTFQLIGKGEFGTLFRQLDAIKASHQALISGGPTVSWNEGPWLQVTFKPHSDFLAIKAFQILKALLVFGEVVEVFPKNPEEIEDDSLFNDKLTLQSSQTLSRDEVSEVLLPISDILAFKLAHSKEDFLEDEATPSNNLVLEVQGTASAESESSTLKVSSKTVDQLIHLVTELTLEHNTLAAIGRNWLNRTPKDQEAKKLQSRLEHADELLNAIQHIALSTRMLPLSTLYKELPRVVRDLAEQLDKRIELTLEGQHLTVDKGILLALHDPLTHLLRNAIDHGIESTSMRSQHGKDSTGHIHISASQTDNSMIITISDDGGGIDVKTIQESAYKKGLVTLEESEYFTQDDWFNLLFSSGFSTKKEATQISGRGVGLDVVKVNLQAVHGSIQVFSELTIGTSFVLKLPISLAMSKTLVVKHKGYQIGIPVSAIQSIYPVKSKNFESTFHVTSHSCSYLWDDVPIPVYDILTREMPDPPTADEKQYLLVIGNSNHLFSVLVDQLCYEEEIVTLPLTPYKKIKGILLANTHLMTGAVLGDGSLCYCFDLGQFNSSDTSNSNQEALCAF